MSLDKELEEAVRTAVADAKQPSSVAQRLIAWLKELSENDLGTNDQASYLEKVRDALNIGGGHHES
jgi:hypothetical protein